MAALQHSSLSLSYLRCSTARGITIPNLKEGRRKKNALIYISVAREWRKEFAIYILIEVD